MLKLSWAVVDVWEFLTEEFLDWGRDGLIDGSGDVDDENGDGEGDMIEAAGGGLKEAYIDVAADGIGWVVLAGSDQSRPVRSSILS